MRFLKKIALVMLMLVAFGAKASDFSIVAIVNDEVISLDDIHKRMRLVLGTSNIPYNEETIARFEPQVVRMLIDDTLKMQEAKRLSIDITEDDTANAIATVEKNNGMPKGGLYELVASFGLSKEILENQMKAEVAWLRIVNREISSKVDVTDEEVNQIIEAKKANIGKPEMLASEIFLAIDTPENEREIADNAKRIFEYIKQGNDFAALARQFSQSPTAAKGGDLEWVSEGQLEKEVYKEIVKMEIGTVSEPIRTTGGYYIVYLRDKKLSSVHDAKRTQFELSQIFVPKDFSEAQKTEVLNQADNTKSCHEFNQLAAQIRTRSSGPIGVIPAMKIPEDIYSIIKDMELNKASKPMTIKEGALIFMVCNKYEEGGIPDFETVRNKLEVQKIDAMAKRKLRDLRRSAIIDLRK